MTREASAARVAAGAAIGAVFAWGLKALAIWNAGGLDKSALESPLFAVGLVLVVLAYGALGVALTAGRSVWMRVAGLVAGLVLGTGLILLVEGVVRNLVPDSAGWVKEEAGLWVASVVTVVVTLAWLTRRDRRFTGETPEPA